MQIVNTKLPNENIQTYQSQMIDSGGGEKKLTNANCDKLPNGTTKVAQNDSEQPILPNSQLFQSLSTTDDRFWGGGAGVNYQTQIVNTKLPNENIQTYQVQMINSEGGG